MIKILNLKLVILLEYQNIKIFLQKAIFQIALKKIFLSQNLKILFHRHMLLVILKTKKLLQRFAKKNCKEVERVIKTQSDKVYIKWKGHDRFFNSWIDKKDIA